MDMSRLRHAFADSALDQTLTAARFTQLQLLGFTLTNPLQALVCPIVPSVGRSVELLPYLMYLTLHVWLALCLNEMPYRKLSKSRVRNSYRK